MEKTHDDNANVQRQPLLTEKSKLQMKKASSCKAVFFKCKLVNKTNSPPKIHLDRVIKCDNF